MQVRTFRFGVLSTLFSLIIVAPAASRDVACVVSDPTGTPLNVRMEPNGRIVMTLTNGNKVRRVGERRHQGKDWALVASGEGTLGWVFSDYLDCVAIDGGQLKSAPMRPRPSGN